MEAAKENQQQQRKKPKSDGARIGHLEKLFEWYRENKLVRVRERGVGMEHSGQISGFDEHGNIVLCTIDRKKILIKGDCIANIHAIDQ